MATQKFLDLTTGLPYLWKQILARLESHNTNSSAHSDIRKLIPTVDNEMSETSTNPVQNKVLCEIFDVFNAEIVELQEGCSELFETDATSTTRGMMSASDKAKLDGIAANANNYSLPAATSSALGGVKIGYSTSGKNYAVALDSNSKMYVNVPWENTTYTALKNPNSLTISLNGSSQGAYDGSAAKSINITPSSIGAAESSHTHSYVPLSGGTMTGALNWTGSFVNTITGNAEADIAFKCVNTNGSSVQFGVGGGRINHGVYSLTLNKWIIYADTSNVYVPHWGTVGSATQPVYFSGGKPVAATAYSNATVGYANYLNTCNTNEICINNATGLTDDGGDIWIGYKWKDSASWTKGKSWRFGNFCGSLGNVCANKFIGSLQGNADTATSLASTLTIAKGGTGSTTASGARTNLGICGAISYGSELPSSGSTGDIFFLT